MLCAQPANDLFANQTVVTGTNIVVTGSNVDATSEAGEPLHADEQGGHSVWWTWTAPFAGLATISTLGSDFDTLLGIYIGSSVSDLMEIASNDDDQGLTSRVTIFAKAGQAYQIAVDGYFGDSGDIQLNIQLSPAQAAPAWLLPDPYGQLVSSTNFAGQVVIFDFWASWCVPCKVEIPDLVALQDKYRADGLAVIGATIWDVLSDTITFLGSNVPPLNYQVIVSDTALAQDYGGISAIPTTFIINRENQIVKMYIGTQSRTTLENQIIPLLYDNMRLDSRKNGNQLVLSWPTNAATFILESSATLTNPVWVQWPTGPTIVNGLNTVQASLSGTNRYFHLRLQQ